MGRGLTRSENCLTARLRPGGFAMAEEPVAKDRPRWVRLGLWGTSTRKSAQGFLYLSAALAVCSGLYGFIDMRFFFGAGLLVSALWYGQAIRWVDRNDRWP